MISRLSKNAARALRRTARGFNVGATIAKNAQVAGELAVASQDVIHRRTQLMSESIGHPLAYNPEFSRMGSEKLMAAFAIGANSFGNLLALHRSWMNFGLAQVRIAQSLAGAMSRTNSPAGAALAVGGATARSMSNGLDAALDVAQSGQALAAGALTPLHRAATRNAKRLARVKKKQSPKRKQAR